MRQTAVAFGWRVGRQRLPSRTMSFDLLVWTRRKSAALSSVLESESFAEIGTDHWELSAKTWMISAYLEPIEDDDIPDEIFSRVRGITCQVSLHVMPISAPASAIAKARRLARKLADAGEGAVQDLQSDNITVAKSARQNTGANAARSGPGNQTCAILSLNWCMDHADFLKRETVETFLDVLERYLPEALPKRYGPYEPPRFKYSEMGRGHFVDAYLDDQGSVIYASKPGISLSLPTFEPGHRKIGARSRYWAHKVEVTLLASVLDDPIWATHLPKAFRVISHCLRPFYGEARVLRGYEVSRNGTLWTMTRDAPTPDGQSEASPVSPWWRGIPSTPATACVIGAPYTELWTGRTGWTEERNLSFLQPDTWTRDATDYQVPEAVACPPQRVTVIRTDEDMQRAEEESFQTQASFPF